MENTGKNNARTILGIVIVVVGTLFLLENFNLIPFDVDRVVFSFPSILIVVGVVSMLNSSNKLFGGVVLTIGVLLQLPNIFPFMQKIDEDIIVPVVIIIFGIYLILRRSAKGSNGEKNTNPLNFRSQGSINKDRIDDVSVFGGGTKFIRSDNFQGGTITAVFGGSEVDLTDCKLAAGDNVLDIVAVFGGMEIIVPDNWNIRVDVFPLFGGFAHKIRRMATDVDTSRTLFIKGIVIFGGGEIKHR